MRIHVLIAEDDAAAATPLRTRLQEQGFDVTYATSGREAMVFVEEEMPDILLLDLLLPDISGFDILEWARQKHAGLPIIILSNLSSEDDRKHCLALGAKDFVVKSDVSMTAIVERVRMAVGK